MLRYRAVEAKQGKTHTADRELAKTDRNGKVARFLAPLANWATDRANKVMRGLVEKVTGSRQAGFFCQNTVRRASKH